MPTHEIQKYSEKEPILAVYCTETIYIGLGRKLVDFSTRKILCIHEKSIRCIAGNGEFIGCCSYDGTATILEKNGKIKEKVEGPDTEMKGLAFYENFLAVTTRGRTTWILEDFEISKILEDHTQDVKGCIFHKSRLFTWSYDNSVKIYDLFDIDHSWELSQSIELGDIVWKIIFFNGYLCATLQNGCLVILKEIGHQWVLDRTIRASITPIYSAAVFTDSTHSEYLGVVCNRNCLLIFNDQFEKVTEIPEMNDGSEVFSSGSHGNVLVLGSLDGTLTKITFT